MRLYILRTNCVLVCRVQSKDMSAMELLPLALLSMLSKSCLVPLHLKTSIYHLSFTIATLTGNIHAVLDQLSFLALFYHFSLYSE